MGIYPVIPMNYAAASGLGRRRFLGLLALLALSPVAAGCRVAAEGTPRVASHVWPGYEFMFFARSQGWLLASDAVLVETPSATQSLRLLSHGEVDGAALTLDEVLRARADGVPLRVALVFNISAGADVLLAHEYVRDLADLAGRRLGVEKGALGALMLFKALETAGLKKSEVDMVPLTMDEHDEAFLSGRVDALITFEPVASRLQAQGALRLFDSRALPETIVDVLAVRPEALKKHARSLRALVAAHFRALEYFQQNPLDAAYRMADRLGLSAAQVLGAYRGLKLPSVEDNRRLLGGSTPPLRQSAERLQEFLLASGLFGQTQALHDLVSDQLLPARYK